MEGFTHEVILHLRLEEQRQVAQVKRKGTGMPVPAGGQCCEFSGVAELGQARSSKESAATKSHPTCATTGKESSDHWLIISNTGHG